MNFKIKCCRVFGFILTFFYLIGDFSVYGGKNSQTDASNPQYGDLEPIGLMNTIDDNPQKSSKELLEYISKNISRDGLDLFLKSMGTNEPGDERNQFLRNVSNDISQKKKYLKELKRTIKDCSKIISEERTIVTIKNIKNIIAVGDLHGDLVSTTRYIDRIESLIKDKNLDHVIFLGDYIDRGPSSISVLYKIINLKLCFPNKVTLLRGNHETKSMFLWQTGNTANFEIDRRFYPVNDKYINKLKKALINWFDSLPFAADIEIDSLDLDLGFDHKDTKNILALHGGFPCEESSEIEPNLDIWKKFLDLRFTNKRCTIGIAEQPYLIGTQILWNDFSDDDNLEDNEFNYGRFCGRVISKKTLENFCKRYGFSFIIRGHTFYKQDPCHNLMNKCYTIFSASDYVGSGNEGCVVYFDYYGMKELS